MTENVKQDEQERHRAKMANRKAAQDAEVAAKTITEKGLLIVHTGTGKGKSTAAFGLRVAHGRQWREMRRRAVHQRRVEHRRAERARRLRRHGALAYAWRRFHLGDAGQNARHGGGGKGVGNGEGADAGSDLKLIVLDEINIALRYDYLPLAEVVETLKARRPDLHVVVTGRNAKREMIEAADLVTEMTLVKHHFAAGVKAQAGIEY